MRGRDGRSGGGARRGEAVHHCLNAHSMISLPLYEPSGIIYSMADRIKQEGERYREGGSKQGMRDRGSGGERAAPRYQSTRGNFLSALPAGPSGDREVDPISHNRGWEGFVGSAGDRRGPRGYAEALRPDHTSSGHNDIAFRLP